MTPQLFELLMITGVIASSLAMYLVLWRSIKRSFHRGSKDLAWARLRRNAAEDPSLPDLPKKPVPDRERTWGKADVNRRAPQHSAKAGDRA